MCSAFICQAKTSTKIRCMSARSFGLLSTDRGGRSAGQHYNQKGLVGCRKTSGVRWIGPRRAPRLKEKGINGSVCRSALLRVQSFRDYYPSGAAGWKIAGEPGEYHRDEENCGQNDPRRIAIRQRLFLDY